MLLWLLRWQNFEKSMMGTLPRNMCGVLWTDVGSPSKMASSSSSNSSAFTSSGGSYDRSSTSQCSGAAYV